MPRAADAEPLITPRTRAIVLVTPGNPSGVTIDPAGIAAFAELARRHDIALIVDETYRSFRGTDEPAHHLFADPHWDRTLVSLHSFAKDLAIPGYRVGAVVASPEVNRQVCKLLDCVADLKKGWQSIQIEPDGRVLIHHADGSEQSIAPPVKTEGA